MLKNTPAQIDAVKINTDAFMALSKISLSSIERLASLNLNATRAILENGVSTASKIQTKDVSSLPDIQSLLPATAVQSATAYLQGVQQIAADTQKEVTSLITAYFAAQGKGTNGTGDWKNGLDLFNHFSQKMMAMTAANGKAVADASVAKKHS
jgi:hypothetical protein